jgi:hypothetical protein
VTHSPIDAPLLAASVTPLADWPTTQRFSRRLGDSLRGAEYAQAIESPTVNFCLSLSSSSRTTLAVAALALLAATTIVYWAR